MCCAGCAELKLDEKRKESYLFSYISSTLEVWNLNIRFNMMWGLFYIDTAPDAFLPQELNVNMLHDL